MEVFSKICSDKTCRTCLCESGELRSLNSRKEGDNKTLLELLSYIVDLQFITMIKPSGQVCEDCQDVIYKASTFKKRCLEVESILKEYIQASSVDDRKAFDFQIKHENLLELNSNPEIESFGHLTQSLDCRNNKNTSQTCAEESMKSSTENNIQDHLSDVKEEADNYFDDSNIEFDTDLYDVPIECRNNKQNTATCERKEVYLESKSKVKTKRRLVKDTNKKKTEDKKDLRTCKVCNKTFKTSFAYKIHLRKHLQDSPAKHTEEIGKFECSECMRQFKKKSSLASHVKVHERRSNLKFECLTCKREFKHKAHLENHVLRIHTKKFQKGFMCVVCMTNFSTEEALELHKETHLMEKKHQCKLCQKSFHMLSTLTDHLRTHTGEKPFLCSICGRGFSQKTNLAQHVRRHEGLKPYPCQQCDQRFVSKGELTAHTRKHSGAHPFVCDDCGGGFTTSSSLVKHRRTHTGERPYACDFCPMRFAASGTLKNHRRTHTGEKPFKCSYCEKAFVQRHDLISHIRCHTGERPYTCSCGQAYRKGSALKTHLKMNTKECIFRGEAPIIHKDTTVLQKSVTVLQKNVAQNVTVFQEGGEEILLQKDVSVLRGTDILMKAVSMELSHGGPVQQ